LFNSFVTDGSAVAGGLFTPNGVWTWNGTTLAAIGLGSLTTTPVTVYRARGSSNDTFQFVTVPEPSAPALLGLGAIGLSIRRRRLTRA
jgi:hypothetical protein